MLIYPNGYITLKGFKKDVKLLILDPARRIAVIHMLRED